jgi:hypothetical protein
VKKRDRKARGSGRQAGAQDHAEGDHGPKTRAHLREQLQAGEHRPPTEERAAVVRYDAAFHGKRRLVEDRQQHDEAEKNSERTRLFIEHAHHRDDGPSDNLGNLHGVLGHREHRADYKKRRRNGLRDAN